MNFSMTLAQWRSTIARFMPVTRRQRTAKVKREACPPGIYRFSVGGRLHDVCAQTRSEARAVLKRQLGVKRLPHHASVLPWFAKQAAA